ncbi:MAG: AtpZ/AtpI family protein [Hyphomicrobiales bacterium]
MGLAFRIATELVAGVLVGTAIGWQLDRWLETSPVMLVIFFGLGTAAGIMNVVRVAKKMQPGADGNRPANGQ